MVAHDDVAPIEAEKRRIRNAVRTARAALGEERIAAAAAGLKDRLRELVSARRARSISCYLPYASEPDTRPFLSWASAEGIEVLLPAARADGLMDWVRDTGAGTIIGNFGITEPIGEHLSPLSVEEADLMLIPASSVDRHGVRLGWGRGYFDRCLGPMVHRPPVFAVVYEEELVDDLPSEPHDIAVTGVVTPERILYLDR